MNEVFFLFLEICSSLTSARWFFSMRRTHRLWVCRKSASSFTDCGRIGFIMLNMCYHSQPRDDPIDMRSKTAPHTLSVGTHYSLSSFPSPPAFLASLFPIPFSLPLHPPTHCQLWATWQKKKKEGEWVGETEDTGRLFLSRFVLVHLSFHKTRQ